jgi:hypothetical protein
MTKKKKVDETEELRNAQELDEKAGVAPAVKPDFGFPGSTLPTREVTRPADAQPLVKTDTREKLLYKIACTGAPVGNEFFDEFPDTDEVLKLALSISVRLLMIAICNSELAATQRIASMRTIIALNGKQLPATEDDAAFKPAPLAIPTGSKEDVTRTLEAIKRVSGA